MIFNTTAFYQQGAGILAQWVSCNIVRDIYKVDMASTFDIKQYSVIALIADTNSSPGLVIIIIIMIIIIIIIIQTLPWCSQMIRRPFSYPLKF